MTDDALWRVVTDREGRHSIWPEELDVPTGWAATDYVGPREACVAHIDAIWSDLVPAGWRQVLDAQREGVHHGDVRHG